MDGRTKDDGRGRMEVGGRQLQIKSAKDLKAERLETEKIRRLKGDKMWEYRRLEGKSSFATDRTEALGLNHCSGCRFPIYYTPQRIGSLPLDDMNPGNIPIQGLEGRFHFGHHTAFYDTICYQGLRFFNPK